MKKIVLISVIVFSIISLSFTGTQQIDAQEEIQAKQILQEVSRAVFLIHNYRCQLSTICRLGGIEEKRIYNYAFQSPTEREAGSQPPMKSGESSYQLCLIVEI